ncbi:MAG TPA: ABC transporter ATP-binding protein [Patescibacteria group bacterium]|nr:ABC transporter ATP-binding protein [Patescibacteria group bacterium]
MSDDIAIRIRDINKSFKLPHEKHGSLKNAFINAFRGKRTYEEQQVLNNISFEIKKGEFFGIVGRNGSGKSTLLKLLAGIYSQDSGSIQVNGKLTPFIELGVGFSPELSGRENVFLNGALLGFDKKQIEAIYDEIVEFAELERFMDQKLKNYSSGMQVRLAFSIAIRANADILVLDEVLAVGDEAFQRKCFAYFAKLKKEKKTVVLVTHSMDSVQQFCTKAMLIREGKIEYMGNTAKVASMYRELNVSQDKVVKSGHTGSLASERVKINAKYNNPSNNELLFKVEITPKENMPDSVIALSITRDTGEIVYRWASNEKLPKNISVKKDKKTKVDLYIQNIFPNGVFSLNLSLRNQDMTNFYFSADEILRFEITNTSSYPADSYWKPNDKVEIRQ